MTGSSISHYHILDKLGEGGMGVVYKAEDLHLGRTVALKFLHASDDLPRLLREARAAASLNHPNICVVHEVDPERGFLAMEFVEGESLAAKLAGRPLRAEEALALAAQIGDGLKAAHDKGIIHRDIKSGNILVTRQGQAKILDFGLARQAGQSALTREGEVAGTPGYMAPEQARGEAVDRRTDIWALGAVLHEMLTGRLPMGQTETLPEGAGRVVRKALAADPRDRYQFVEDLLVDLRRTAAAPGARPSRWRWLWAAAVGVVLAGLGGYVLSQRGEESSWRNATFAQLTSHAGAEYYPSLSPDGRSFVFAGQASGNWDIYLQRSGGKNPINLTKDSPADDTEPAFSPDGERIAFRSEREGGGIFVMGATGESVNRLTDLGHHPAWSPDGQQIVCATTGFDRPDVRYTSTSQLFAVAMATGQKRLLTEGIPDAVQPGWSPHGHRIAFWGFRKLPNRDIWTIPAQGGAAVTVTDDAWLDWNPVWSPDGKYLHFASDRGGSTNLWRVRIDEASGRLLGQPEPVTVPSPYSGYMSFSGDGRRLAYVQLTRSTNLQRVRFDPAAEAVPGTAAPITQGVREILNFDVSPDGQWVAFGQAGKQEDIWVMRTDGTDLRQLTDDIHRDRGPRWSPDGSRIAFFSNRSGRSEIWSICLDGSELRQLTDAGCLFPFWSPDGARIIATTIPRTSVVFDPGRSWDEQTPVTLPALDDSNARFQPWSWSPDGRRLAGNVQTEEGGPMGIVVYDFESRRFERVSDYGRNPRWLPDGRRLLFHDHGKIHLLDTGSGKTREVLSAAAHWIGDFFALSRDGRLLCFGLTATEADIWLMSRE